jgi:membrane protein required for colicin V production
MESIDLTLVDYGFILILVVSLAVAIWRGVVREIISLVGWIVAILVSWLYGPLVAQWLPEAWAVPLRVSTGYIAAFVATLVLAGLMGFVASRLVRAVGLGPVDRLLGAVFGLVRGVVIVVVIVALVGLTPMVRKSVWRHSVLVSYAVEVVEMARHYLPSRPPFEAGNKAATSQRNRAANA